MRIHGELTTANASLLNDFISLFQMTIENDAKTSANQRTDANKAVSGLKASDETYFCTVAAGENDFKPIRNNTDKKMTCYTRDPHDRDSEGDSDLCITLITLG